MIKFLVSGIVAGYRVESWVNAVSIHQAIKLFEGMNPGSRNVYVLEQG